MANNNDTNTTGAATPMPDLTFQPSYRPQLTPFESTNNILSLYKPLQQSGIQPQAKDAGVDPSVNAIFARMNDTNGLVGASPDITTSLSATERYDDPQLGYSSFRNNEDAYAQMHKQTDGFFNNHFNPLNGSGGPLSVGFWGGLAAKAIGKLGDGVGNLFSLAQYGVHGAAEWTGAAKDDNIDSFGEWLTVGGDNVLNKVFGGLDKAVDKYQNTYQEAEDVNKSLFNRLFTDGDFWNTSIKDGVAFLASAVAPAAILGKIGLGARLASQLGKTATALEATEAAAGAIGAEGALTTGSLQYVGGLGKALGLNAARVSNLLDYGANLAYNVPMEASMEAKGVGLSVYDSMWGQVNPETGQLYTDDEKTKIAGLAASQVYKQNLVVLAFSNALELRSTFKALGIGNKALTAELSGLGLAEVTVARNASKWAVTGNAIKEIAKGQLSEGFFEENVQYAIQKTAEEYGGGSMGVNEATNKSSIEQFGKTLKKWGVQTRDIIGGNSTDKELNESVFIGGLLGSLGGVGAVKDHIKQKKTNEYAANEINKFKSSFLSMDNPYEMEVKTVVDKDGKEVKRNVVKIDEKGQPVISKDKAMGTARHIQYMDQLNTIIDKAEQEGNTTQAEIAKKAAFMNLAGEYAKYGLLDKLVESLDKAKTANPEDLKLLMPTLDFDDKTAMAELPQKIEELKSIAKEVDAAYDYIDKNVIPSSPRKADQNAAILRKAALMRNVKQNLALKLYRNGINKSNVALNAKILSLQEQNDILDSLDSPEVIDNNLQIDELNHLITQKRALDNTISSANAIMNEKALRNEDYSEDDVTLSKHEAEAEKLNKEISEKENVLKDTKLNSKKDEDGFHMPRTGGTTSIESLQAQKDLRINKIKLEEINIAQSGIIDEYKKMVAMVEPKAAQGRSGRFSRNMIGRTKARNQYYEREVRDRKLSFVKPLRLKGTSVKSYADNEKNRLADARISSRVERVERAFVTEKLLKVLPTLTTIEKIKELIGDIRKYGGTLSESEREDLIEALEENPIVAAHQKQIDDLDDRIEEIEEIQDREDTDISQFDELENEKVDIESEISALKEQDPLAEIVALVNSINTEDTSKLDVPRVQRIIADEYLRGSEFYTDDFNFEADEEGVMVATPSKEMEDDLTSIINKIDTLEDEKEELGRLKDIFEKRPEVLATPAFKGFTESIDNQIANIEATLNYLNELKDSRSREDKNSLVNHVNLVASEIGLSIGDNQFEDQDLFAVISDLAPASVITSLKEQVDQLKATPQSEVTTDQLWKIRSTVKGIIEHVKLNPEPVLNYIQQQQDKVFDSLESSIFKETFSRNMDVFNRDYRDHPVSTFLISIMDFNVYSIVHEDSNHKDGKSAINQYKKHLDLLRFLNDLNNTEDPTDYSMEGYSKADLVSTITDHIKFTNLHNLKNSILTKNPQLQQVNSEIDTLKSLKTSQIPSNQQLLAIRAFADYFLRALPDDNIFSKWAYLKAPAGTGKSLVVGKWIPNVLGLSIKDGEILATGHNKSSSANINSAIGTFKEHLVSDIIDQLNMTEGNENLKLIVIDEISGITEQQISDLNKALEGYIERTGNDVRVLALGDPNQMVIKNGNKLGFQPFIEASSGRVHETTKIEVLPALTIRYRSNISSVNNFSDKFNNEVNDLTNKEMKVKSNTLDITDPNIKGVVHVINFEADLLTTLKNIDPKDKKTRTIITNPERAAKYRDLLLANGITGVNVADFIEVQGQTIDNVYVDIDSKDDLFKFDKEFQNELFNKAMYVATSRATNFVMVTGFNNIENVEDRDLDKNLAKTEDSLKEQKGQFEQNRQTEQANLKEITKDIAEDEESRVKDEEETKEEEAEESEAEPVVTDTVPDSIDSLVDTVADEDEDGIQDTDNSEEDYQEEVKTNQDEFTTTEEELARLAEQVKSTPLDKIVKIINTTFEATRAFVNGKFMSMKKADLISAEIESRPIEAGDRVFYIAARDENNKGKYNSILVMTQAKDSEGNVIEGKYRQIGFIGGESSKEFTEMAKKKELLPVIEKFKDFLKTGTVDGKLPPEIFKEKKIVTLKKAPMILHEATVVSSVGMKYKYSINPDGTFKGSNVNIERILTDIVKFFGDGSTTKLSAYKENSYIKVFKRSEIYNRDDKYAQFADATRLGILEPGVPYLVVSGKQGDITQIVRLSRKKLDMSNLHHVKMMKPILDVIGNIEFINKHINETGVALKKVGDNRVNADLKAISRINLKEGEVYTSPTSNYKYNITNEFLDHVKSLTQNSYSEPKRSIIEEDLPNIKPDSVINVSNEILKDEEYSALHAPILTGVGKGELAERSITQKNLRVISVNADTITASYKGYTDMQDTQGTEVTVEIPFKYVQIKESVKTGRAQGILNALAKANKSLREHYKIEKEDNASGKNSAIPVYKFPSILSDRFNPVTDDLLDTLKNIMDFQNNNLNLRVPVPIYKKFISKDGTQPTVLLNFRNNTDTSNPNSINNQAVLNTFFESNFEGISPTAISVTFDESNTSAKAPVAPKVNEASLEKARAKESKKPSIDQTFKAPDKEYSVKIDMSKVAPIIVPIDGNFLHCGMMGRIFTLVQVGNTTLPFYMSSEGTSGKAQGKWFPFFADTPGWIVKGSVTDMSNGYGIKEIQEAQKILNDNIQIGFYPQGLGADGLVKAGKTVIFDLNKYTSFTHGRGDSWSTNEKETNKKLGIELIDDKDLKNKSEIFDAYFNNWKSKFDNSTQSSKTEPEINQADIEEDCSGKSGEGIELGEVDF